jgi:periplasmic protein CpxP/Spy
MSNETMTKTARSRRYGWLMALPLAGVLAVPAVSAFAQEGKPEAGEYGGHFGGGRHMKKLLDEANATPAQREKIKATWTALRPQLQAVREERGKLRAEMRKALTAPTIDTGRVEQLRRQEVALADKSSAIVTKGIVESAQVLSPEQRQKIATQMENHPRFGRHARAE